MIRMLGAWPLLVAAAAAAAVGFNLGHRVGYSAGHTDGAEAGKTEARLEITEENAAVIAAIRERIDNAPSITDPADIDLLLRQLAGPDGTDPDE